MKHIILLLVFPFMCNFSFGQNKVDCEKLVGEGVQFHDKGDYIEAISRYDQALELDRDNVFALAEKAFSLMHLQKYTEAIDCCQRAIDAHPGDNALKTVYVTYGNAYDVLKKSAESIEIYNEGISQFPDFYQLYFNKGITLSSMAKYDEAISCFQKAVMLNPDHGSSHNALARMHFMNERHIPALLAFCRFLSLEPQGARASENLSMVQTIMKGNVEKTGKKSVTININPEMFGDTMAGGKPAENSFTSTELMLALSSALDYDKKYKKEKEVQRFIRKLDLVCSSLNDTQGDNSGFYWDYYVPFFTEMKDREFIETFAYIALASSDESTVAKWLKTHTHETDRFFEWVDAFQWKSY